MAEFSFEVLRLLCLCDFIGLSNEKLEKRTSFETLINADLHLSIALRLSVFITEDKNLLIKAKFIKKWMSVNIFNMDSFIQTVLKHVYNKTSKETIEVSSNEGNKIVYKYFI